MSTHQSQSADAPRRSFIKSALAVLFGGTAVLAPLVPGVAFLLDPLLRKRSGSGSVGGVEKDEDGFVRMAVTVSALPEDGSPQQVTVLDDKTDAWNRSLNVPVGSIWLRRIRNNVIAFNSICPHLGCAVEHRTSQGDFYCPCHTSAFDLDGKKLNEIPPRGLDTLEVRRKKDGVESVDGDEIWIRFLNFRAATAEKIPV